MMRDRLTQRVLEQYRNEDLNEHYEHSRKYFTNIFSLALFIGFIALFVVVQNHYSMYFNYAKYDLMRYDNMVDESITNEYESVRGEAALPLWERYKKTIRTSALPETDQNYILAQKALLLNLPKSEELEKLSVYFEYQVKTEDLDYVNTDHNILNRFIFTYSPYTGTDRKMFVKLQAELYDQWATKIVRENYANLFLYNASMLLDQYNRPIHKFAPVGLINLILFGFVFSLIYGVIMNLAARYEAYH